MPRTRKRQEESPGATPAAARPSMFHGFLTFQSRGVVAFPAELRRRLRADRPGLQLEVIEREDGVFEMRPVVPVPADQEWFWTERWQAMEREADADVAAGRVSSSKDVDEFLAELDNLR